MKYYETVGHRFGRLVVKKMAATTGRRRYRAVCLCDCGNTTEVYAYSLLKGETQSCGCYSKECSQRPISHGMTNSPEYSSWLAMKQRCYNKNNEWYKQYYSSRGITVCKRWRDSFENFYADMGPRPTGTELDRINNNKNYTPQNCRWATRREQAQNRGKYNRNITYKGRTMCIAEWARETGIHYKCLHKRIRMGWPPERALKP